MTVGVDYSNIISLLTILNLLIYLDSKFKMIEMDVVNHHYTNIDFIEMI